MEVVWSGSTWRNFPPPVIGQTVDAPPPMRSKPGFGKGEKRAIIAQAIGPAFASLTMLQDRTGLSYHACARWADRLVAEGFVERIAQRAPSTGGHPRWLYRRRQAQTEAAA